MLAEAMVRLSRGKPTRRYAMDPDALVGLQNYIRLFLRGQDVPRQHMDAQHVLQPHYDWDRDLHRDQQELFGRYPDHATLAKYLDQLNMAGVEEGHPNHALADMLPILYDLHHQLGRTPQMIGQRFSPHALNSQPVRELVQRLSNDVDPSNREGLDDRLRNLFHTMRRYPGGDYKHYPALLAQHQQDLQAGLSGSLGDIYDTGLQMGHDNDIPATMSNSGHGLSHVAAHILGNRLLPRLLQGETDAR
jgi:hypothetical protein